MFTYKEVGLKSRSQDSQVWLDHFLTGRYPQLVHQTVWIVDHLNLKGTHEGLKELKPTTRNPREDS